MAGTKGTSLVNIVKLLRANKEAARREVPARLQSYLETRVVLLAWYPEEDFLELARALARILPSGGPAPWEWMGRESARRDLAEVYRPLLRPGDPLGTLAKGALLWSAYHDSGRFRALPDAPGSARLELADFGLPAVETCEIFRGYFAEVLRAAGARSVEVTQIACRTQGAQSCLWQAKWEPPEPA